MYNQIGRKIIRVDGKAKAFGKTRYGDDLKFDNMLFAACRYTEIPAGKIRTIDLSGIENDKNITIATFKDLTTSGKIGPIRQDAFPIIDKKISFIGDVIVVVAANSKEKALSAVEKISVVYDREEGIFSPKDSAKKDAKLIHPEYKSNLVVHYPLRKGNIEEGFTQSDFVIEREYETGFQEHAYIEPETVTAVPDEQIDGFTIYGSIQNPFTTRKVVAMYLGIAMNKVNVVPTPMGGSFGGKDDIVNMMACRVALLCKKSSRPVQLTNSREQSLVESYKRHPYFMKYKVGFNKNGKLNAMKINIIADSGAYSSQSYFVTWRSVVQATGPYEIPNVETDIRAYYTNNVYTAAFRGFGSPQVIFAQESLMDEIASICNLNPLEIRLKNGFKDGSVTASGQKLDKHKVTLREILESTSIKAKFLEKWNKENSNNERFAKGIGLAISYRGCSLGAEGTDASSAIVSVQADGSVYVMTALNENGQGLQTTFSIIAAEVLGITTDKIVFIQPPTQFIADGGPTVASRSTLMGGQAVKIAAEKVKSRILSILKDKHQSLDEQSLNWANNKISNNDFSILFSEAAESAYWAGENLSAYGWYKSPEVSWEEETGQGDAYFTYVYGCHIAEIEVDKLTGKISVENLTATHDVGKVINKIGAEGQVYGGSLQGLGYGIFEDFSTKDGIVKSQNFDQYLIPTIKDMPKTTAILFESDDPFGPFGAKSLGEPTLELTAAAINNAYANATGNFNKKIPLTLEQVRLGKNLQKPKRQSEANNSKERKQQFRLPEIEIFVPKNLNEAIELLKTKDAKVLAGGTDLLVQLRHQKDKQNFVSLENISELFTITEDNSYVCFGGGITISELEKSEIIKSNFPLFIEAISHIGSKQIRNRATVAGNIVNSAPCADTIPPLLAYNTEIILSGSSLKCISLADFLVGSYQTKLKKNEIIISFKIPKINEAQKYYYEQIGRRNAVNITRLSISILKIGKNDFRIVPGSLIAPPKRLTELEKLCSENASNKEIAAYIKNFLEQKIGNRWSSEYKIPVFTELFLYAFGKMKK